MKQAVGFDSHCLRVSDLPPAALINLCNTKGFSSLGLYYRHVTSFATTASTIGSLAQSRALELALCGIPLKDFLCNKASPKTLLRRIQREVKAAAGMKASALRLYCFDLGERERDFSTVSMAEFYTTLQTVYDVATDSGLLVTLENHGDFLSEDIVRACDKVRGLRVCFDFSNQFAVGESPSDAIDRLLPLVSMVHLKDAAFGISNNQVFWRSVPLGKGALDLNLYIRRVNFLQPSAMMLEASTSGGKRQAGQSTGLIRKRFIDFCSTGAAYSVEFDTYQTRNVSSREAIVGQERRHLEDSIAWLKRSDLM